MNLQEYAEQESHETDRERGTAKALKLDKLMGLNENKNVFHVVRQNTVWKVQMTLCSVSECFWSVVVVVVSGCTCPGPDGAGLGGSLRWP